MSPELVIAWATPAEAAAMAEAHGGAFEDSWREEDFEDLLDGAGIFGFVAKAEAPAGVILCRIAAQEMEVLTLGVAPGARRRGVAKALMEAALAAARRAGAKAAFLEVAVDNPPAVALYAGLGFRQAGLRRRYYDRGGGVFVDAHVMRLDLNDPAG
ncbi:N-acetyltransferase [Phenylobacterium sp.]|uniref:GNAT family N-acetyltransferase n=1 Tax=Phenylobacterium sp. TaxID=1871053 RepID=UPI0026073BE3|nr:N-acetyltransferase [Phenylobacterium sp.]